MSESGNGRVYDLNREMGALTERVQGLDRKMDGFGHALEAHRVEAAAANHQINTSISAITTHLARSDTERAVGQAHRASAEAKFRWVLGLLVAIGIALIGWLVS